MGEDGLPAGDGFGREKAGKLGGEEFCVVEGLFEGAFSKADRTCV